MTPEDIEIRLLLDAIYLRYHYDFRGYAMASLRRRLRAATDRLRAASLSQLQEQVLRDPQVFTQLLQHLTVQVSEMFRDPPFYRCFRERVLPVLSTYPSLKLWIAGCSTGEELYSFAIVLHEEGLLERSILYATDINPEALARAEAGIYSLDRVAGFAESYRQAGGTRDFAEYYRAAYKNAMFDRALRKNVVFSDHSLATDSVFGEMHVVSCRNVLIYFNRSLQNRGLELMRDSLCRRGFLGLGAKETTRFSSIANDVEPFAPECQWHRKG